MGVLRFRLFGFPVDVQPGFWLLALFFGLWLSRGAIGITLIWVGVVFVSILIHEMGHALTARRFGMSPFIVLHTLGGVTAYRSIRALSRARQVLVTLAGPFAGFALGAASWAAFELLSAEASLSEVFNGVEVSPLSYALGLLVWVNAFYGIINLLPVLPFDGGQVVSAALGPKRRMLSATLSLVFGLLIALFFWSIGWVVMTALFAMSAVLSYLAVRRHFSSVQHPDVVGEVLQRAREALHAGKHEEAAIMARAVLDSDPKPPFRRQALELGAWAALLGGEASQAEAMLGELGADGPVDALLQAAVVEKRGDTARARSLLSSALEGGDRRPELVGALVRMHAVLGELDAACELAALHATRLEPDDLRRLMREAATAGAVSSAASLGGALYQHSGVKHDALEAARLLLRADHPDQARELIARATDAGHVDAADVSADAELRGLSGAGG